MLKSRSAWLNPTRYVVYNSVWELYRAIFEILPLNPPKSIAVMLLEEDQPTMFHPGYNVKDLGLSTSVP
jgi:hypothetical protein